MLLTYSRIFFFRNMLDKLWEFSQGQLIVGGYLNVPLIPKVDTFLGSFSVLPGSCKLISQSLYGAQVVDVWRFFHPGKIDNTFFSSPHILYSRIDFFYPPWSITFCWWNHYWVDHLVGPCATLLKYNISELQRIGPSIWKLNESLLQDPGVLADVCKEVMWFFQTNDTPDCDTPDCTSGLVWEAHKAVIQGVLKQNWYLFYFMFCWS